MIREIYEGDFRPVDNMGMSEEYQEKRQIAYELGKQFMDSLNQLIRTNFQRYWKRIWKYW